MTQALIFDFDGLILDTEVPDYESWQELYGEFGCELPLAEWTACIGTLMVGFDVFDCLERQLGRAIDRDASRARRRARYRELVEAQEVLPGVVEYLDEARRLGLKVGLASSSDRAWVTGHLSRLGLADRFECLRCREDVTNVKPDPALYRSAVEALDLQPHHAVALEDSPNGIRSAKRAGLFCVAVPNAMTRPLRLDEADVRLVSLAHLPLEQLLETARRRDPS